MRNKMRNKMILALIMVLVGTSALAAPVPFNTRPVSYGPGTTGERPLFTGVSSKETGTGILEGLAYRDQLNFDYFDPLGDSATFTLKFEIAGHAGSNELYIYSLYDTLKTLKIFSGPDSPTTTRSVKFVEDPSTHNYTVTSYAGSTPIASNVFHEDEFGFFLKYGSQKFYGDDELNPGGVAQMLVFNGKGNFADYLWFAFEDLPVWGSSDRDYQDMVFKVKGIEPYFPHPVPEMGAGALFFTGIFGLIAYRRRKRLS